MFKQMSDRTKGILALIFLAVVYAGTGVVTRYLSFYFSLFQQIYIRTLLAFILGMVFFSKSIDIRKLRKVTASEWFLIIVRSAASFVFGTALWVKATTLTKLANVAFIDSLPITATLSFLFLLEKATLKKVILLLISFAGVIILSVKDWSSLTNIGIGELMVFTAGFFFAFRNISRVWHSKLLNDAEITQLMFLTGSVMLFFTSFVFGEPLIMPSWNGGLVTMLLLGGFIMIANIFLSNFGFAHIPAVMGNNILNLEAIFAIVFGFAFYGEVSTIKELIGGALIIISVIKMNQVK